MTFDFFLFSTHHFNISIVLIIKMVKNGLPAIFIKAFSSE
jgi:hypothetical protein